MRWALGAAVAGILLASCGGGTDREKVTLGEWAIAVCGTVDDPEPVLSILSVASEDTQRAQEAAQFVADEIGEIRVELDGLDPPREARAYHRALVSLMDLISDLYAGAANDLEGMSDHEEMRGVLLGVAVETIAATDALERDSSGSENTAAKAALDLAGCG